VREKLMPRRASRASDAYSAQLKREFSQMIDGLALGDLQKRFLHGRWLEQLLWFESKSESNQRRYYALRLVTIVGGVIVPALISLNLRSANVAESLGWVTFGISLVVATSAALESFFRYGENYRMFRRTAEALKGQGWMFFELTGPYRAEDHKSAFPKFAAQVETLVRQDVDTFIAQAQAAEQRPEALGAPPNRGAAAS
jgi:Protein of unknown function (DUF4231)